MEVKLIEALARRKELQEKVDQLRNIQPNVLSETKSVVKNIGKQALDEIVAEVQAQVPKISTIQLTHAFDWHAKQLRRIDVAIQQANHITDVDLDGEIMNDYVDPYLTKETK